MRTWIWIVIAAAAGTGALVAVVAVVGASLPAEHRAAVEGRVDAPPDAVWAALGDLEAWPAWHPTYAHAETVSTERGPSTRLMYPRGREGIDLLVDEAIPGERLVVRPDPRRMSFEGGWTLTLTPDGDGTIVRIVEEARLANPLARLGAGMFLDLDGEARTTLSALQAHLGGSGIRAVD